MEIIKCKCGDNIHPERTEYGYETCIKCSTEKAYVGVMEFSSKTAGYLVKARPDKNAEGIRRMRADPYYKNYNK